MFIVIWAVIGIISSLCCMLLSGLRMGRGIRQYLEVSLVGAMGGILGSILVQNVNLFLGNIFGPLYRETGFFTDGVLTGLLLCLWGCTLYLHALRPSTRRRIGCGAFLFVLGMTIVLSVLLMGTFLLRTPMEDAYLLLLELPTPYQYLDSNTILVTYIAPFCSGWLTILAISAIFQLSSIVIEVSPMPVNSLALSLLRLLKSNRQLKHTGSYLRIGDHLGPISSLAWSDNGKQLISVSSHHICFSDIKTGQTLYSQDLFPIPTTVSWSSHGILLAIASQSVKVASITTSQPFQVSSPEQFSTTLFTEAIAPIWSPNGKFITIVTEKSTIRICHAHNGETVIEYKEHTSNVLALAWSPDGTLIASSDSEHNIHIWDTVEGKTSNTNKEHEETIHALAWSANCKHIAFGCDDGTIHISDVETGTIIHTCKGHNAPINALAWSPNSKMIVSGSQDQTAYTWYVEDEKILTKHLAHKQAITALKWSPDGTLIASGSQDATVHIWRAPHIRKNKVTNRKSKTKN